MSKKNCDKCPFRARYDKNPKSVLGRIWRWHIRWCPGWKSFMNSFEEHEKIEIMKRYDIR